MITEDEATRLLKRADPARVDAIAPVVDAASYLAALRTRSTNVTLIDTESTNANTNARNRRPVIAVAAAAVVAVVVGALVLAARGDSETPVPANTTVAPVPDSASSAEEVARAFLDAYVANDADRAFTYLADDLIVANYGSAEDFRREIAWNEAAKAKMILDGCESRDRGAAIDTTVRCSYAIQAFGSDNIGLGPFIGNSWDFTIRDGTIVAAESTWDPVGFSDQVWEPFANWIETEHPDDVLVMYQDATQQGGRNTPEALRLWEERTDEYIEAVLVGREQYPADVAAICADQSAQLAALTGPADRALDQVATWSAAAAAIMQQTHSEMTALSRPPGIDPVAYSNFYGQLIRLVHNLEDAAAAATAADSALVDELETGYLEIREGIVSSPSGAGLEECVTSLPS